MADKNINQTDLRNLLSRFSDENTVLPNKTLLLAERFLFHGEGNLELSDVPALQRTLTYLRNLMERNGFTTLNDLEEYYERKRKRASELFDKLEQIDPEECMAIDFHEACTMYMLPVREEHVFKSSCLYYLNETAEHVQTGIKIIAYKASLEEERRYLSAVKGNSVTAISNKRCLPRHIVELISN